MSTSAHSHLERGLLVLLGLCLALVFSNFVFDFGNYKTQVYGVLFFLLLLIAASPSKTLRLLGSKEVKLLIGIPAALLLLGLLPTPAHAPQKRYLQSLVYFVVLTLAIRFLLERMSKQLIKQIPIFATLFFGVGLIYHLQGLNTHIPESGHYWNPHYLAQFSLFALLAFAYAMMKWRTRTMLCVGLLLSVGAIYLLLISQSRPAWLALLLGLCFVTYFYAAKNRRWIYLGLILLFFVMVYVLMPDVVAKRVDDLAFNVQNEERVALWSDGLLMQSKVAWPNWLVGHGPGSYFTYAQHYASYVGDIRFPHNFLMELVFESGLIGLALIIAIYVLLIIKMHRHIIDYKQDRLIMATFLTMLVTHLLFCFLTMPFYFNNTVLLQSPLIAGTLYLFAERPPANRLS